MIGQKIIELARQNIGTPFQKDMSILGVGCDCVGLFEAIFKELKITTPPRFNNELYGGLKSFLHEVSVPNSCPGDLLLFSQKVGFSPTHIAVLTNEKTIIHAHWTRGVVENNYSNWFARRHLTSFRYME